MNDSTTQPAASLATLGPRFDRRLWIDLRAVGRPLAALDGGGPEDREHAVDRNIERFARFGASLAAVKLPGFCGEVGLWSDARLARDIGAARGHCADDRYWRAFVANLVGASSSWRSALLRTLMPARSRALDAYASTYAVGKMTRLYLERFRTVETEDLRASFLGAKRRGLCIAKAEWPEIERMRTRMTKLKSRLDAALADGTIDEDQYRRRLVALA